MDDNDYENGVIEGNNDANVDANYDSDDDDDMTFSTNIAITAL